MTREQHWVILFLSLSLSLFFFLTNLFSDSDSVGRIPSEGGPSSRKSPEGEFMVEVEGSVKRRGVYKVGAGMTVLDAIEKAGGVCGRLTLDPEGLLGKLEKSCRVNVLPATGGKGRVLIEPLAPKKLKVLSLPININTAGAEELDTLPGIGPKTAQAIIEYRQAHGKFASPEDLLQVRGIGPNKLAAIRAHITVQ
jgi:competence protein ComEA